jgi:hypothetical protein
MQIPLFNSVRWNNRMITRTIFPCVNMHRIAFILDEPYVENYTEEKKHSPTCESCGKELEAGALVYWVKPFCPYHPGCWGLKRNA